MNAQTTVVDFAHAVGRKLPVFLHCFEHVALAQLAHVDLASVAVAVHVATDVGEEMAVVESELVHAVSGIASLPQFLGNIFKTVDHVAVDRVEHRSFVRAINVEEFSAVASVVILAEQHFHYWSHSKSYPALGVEIGEVHVGVAAEAPLPGVDVAALLVVPAIDGGLARIVAVVTYCHDVALSFFKGEVANEVEVVGAIRHFALVHVGDQCQCATLDVDLIDGDDDSSGASHGSHPNVAEVVAANAGVAQKHTIGCTVECQLQVFSWSASKCVEAVNHTLQNCVVLTSLGIGDNNLFLLTARHVHHAACHRGCAGVGVAYWRCKVSLAGMHTVEHPQVFHPYSVNFGIGLTIGHSPCSHGGHHRHCCYK